jgi:hypothetical protein
MDGSRFDAWTRRQFGYFIGGFASLFGLAAIDEVEAKKKHKHKKKKKCKKLLVTCGGKKKCCKGLTCDTRFGTTGTICCKPLQRPCTDAGECCNAFGLCANVDGLTGERCCTGVTGSCTVKEDCCGDLICGLVGGGNSACVPPP